MSQLNNEDKNENIEETKEEAVEKVEEVDNKKEENKPKKEKKEKKAKKERKKLKTKTKIIIFLVAFTIICIGVTAALILVHKNNNVPVEEKTEEEKKKEIYEAADDGFGIKSLTEKYDGNDLKIETLEDGVGTRTTGNEYDRDRSKIMIEYITIDGLKNGEIENKINQEIKSKVYGMYSNDDISNQSIEHIFIRCHGAANFGNVLSVIISRDATYKTNNEYKYEYKVEYLNYDLTTGNSIKFEELFTNKTSLKNVLIPAINKSLRNEAMQGLVGGESIDFAKADLSQTEEQSYQILDEIMKNIDNIKFGFTYDTIYLTLDDRIIEIEMPDIYKNIAIYKRFLTKDSIFDGSYTSKIKNAFVFTLYYFEENGKIYRIIDDLDDNLRIEAIVNCSETVYAEEEGKKLYNDYVGIIADQIEKLKTEAKNNPNKQILYVAEYWINGYENQELSKNGIKNIMVHTSGQGNIYRMDKKYYGETFYEKMAEYRRNMMHEGGLADEICFYYVEENDRNVDVEEIKQEYETFDLFTNKTAEQLNGIANIKSFIRTIEHIRDIIRKADYYENMSFYKDVSIIENIQEQYNLKDDKEANELKEEAQAIIDETKKIVEEKKQEQEKQRKQQEEQKKQQEEQNNNTESNNIIVNTIETQNEIVNNNNTNP